MGRDEHEMELVVAKVINNPMLPIYQYSFEAPHNGFACGEQSIREKQDDPDLTLRECFQSESERTKKLMNINMAFSPPLDDE